jgi:aminopeptidase N
MKQTLLFLLLLLNYIGYAQYDSNIDQSKNVDFVQVDAEVSILPINKLVKGEAVYKFKTLRSLDSVFIDAKNMSFSEVILNGKTAKYNYDASKIWIRATFSPNKEYSLFLKYETNPSQTMYFINWEAPKELEVPRQGQVHVLLVA